MLTLNRQPDISPAKLGLFGSNNEFQFGTCGLMANHAQVPGKRGEETLREEEVGRAMINQEYFLQGMRAATQAFQPHFRDFCLLIFK